MRKRPPLYTAQIPAVSHEFAKRLDQTFRNIEVKPGVTLEELQYNAGQRSVVDFVIRSASGTTVSGDINDIKPEVNTTSLLERLLGTGKK